MALARAMLSGTLATDPEKRYTQNNAAVTNFVIQITPSITPGSKQQAEPFQVRVACWRGLADAAAQSLQKGDHILVDGRLSINAYQGQDGTQKKQYEIDASSLSKLTGPAETIIPVAEGAAAPAGNNASFAPQTQQQAPVSANTGYATPPVSNAGYAANNTMTADDFLTEDDIPF